MLLVITPSAKARGCAQAIQQVTSEETHVAATSSQALALWVLALIHQRAVDIVQPDLHYGGGLIRATKVARRAAAAGMQVVPHMSGGGLGFLYNSHLVSVLTLAGAHHEFKGLSTQVPFGAVTTTP